MMQWTPWTDAPDGQDMRGPHSTISSVMFTQTGNIRESENGDMLNPNIRLKNGKPRRINTDIDAFIAAKRDRN